MSTSSTKLFHPNELKKVIDAFYLKNKSNLDVSGTELLNYLRQNTQLTTKNLKENQDTILKIAKKVRKKYTQSSTQSSTQKYTQKSTSSFAVSSPTFGLIRSDNSNDGKKQPKRSSPQERAQSPIITSMLSPKYTKASPVMIGKKPNSPIDFNFISKLSPDYGNDPYISPLIGKKPPSLPEKKQPISSLSPKTKIAPRINLTKKKIPKEVDVLPRHSPPSPNIGEIMSPLQSSPKKPSPKKAEQIRFDIDDEVEEMEKQKEKPKGFSKKVNSEIEKPKKSGRKKTYVLNCTDIDACKKKAQDNNERVNLERIKMLARSCDVSEDVINSSKTRSKICDEIGKKHLVGFQGGKSSNNEKKEVSTVKRKPRQNLSLNCQDILACKNKKMENGEYVGVERIRKLAKEECGLSDAVIAEAKTRNKICDAIGLVHVEGFEKSGVSTNVKAAVVKKRKPKKSYTLSCSDADACRNKKMENGEYVGVERIKKLAKEECGLSDEVIAKAKTRNKICDAIEKSYDPNIFHEKEKVKRGKKVKKAKNNVEEFIIQDSILLEKSAEELKQILIAAKQIKASHILPVNKNDIIEQYIKAPKCEPLENKLCDEGKVCDMRSATKKNMVGFCVDPKFLIRSKATHYEVNNKTLIGPKKLIDAIKLASTEETPIPSQNKNYETDLDKDELEVIKDAFFNDNMNPFEAYEVIRSYRETAFREQVLNDKEKKKEVMNTIKHYRILGDRIPVDIEHLSELVASIERQLEKIDERIGVGYTMETYFSTFVKLDNELVMGIMKGENGNASQENMKDLLSEYVHSFVEGIKNNEKINYFYFWNTLVPGMRQAFLQHCYNTSAFTQEFKQAMETWFNRYDNAPDATEEDLDELDNQDIPSDTVKDYLNQIVNDEITKLDLDDDVLFPENIKRLVFNSFLTEMYFTPLPSSSITTSIVDEPFQNSSQSDQGDKTTIKINMPLSISFPDSSVPEDASQQAKVPRIPIKLGQFGKSELKKITLENLKQLPQKLQNIKQNANQTGSIANMENKDYIRYIQSMGLVPISPHQEYEDDYDELNDTSEKLDFMFF